MGAHSARAAEQCVSEISNWTGAYYYKVIATQPSFGIRGQVTLPRFTTDPKRMFHVDHDNPKHLPKWEGTLDVASIYVGAVTHQGEVDAGVNYQQIFAGPDLIVLVDSTHSQDVRQKAHQYLLDVSRKIPVLRRPDRSIIAEGWADVERQIRAFKLVRLRAFTPFWRNTKWNFDATRFFLPGETIRISLTVDRRGNFKLYVRNLTGTNAFAVDFHHATFSPAPAKGFLFKRINSIDQFAVINNGNTVVGNERTRMPNRRSPAIPTQARAEGAIWEAVNLVRPGGGIYPLAPPICKLVRPSDLRHSFNSVFGSGGIDSQGGEVINIRP